MSEPTIPTDNESAPTFIDAEPARLVSEGTTSSRSDRARSAAYRSRFTIVYAGLAVVAALGLTAFLLLMNRPAAAPSATWSTWVPTGSDSARAKQIADHVSRTYRQPDGQQLTTAIVGPPQVTAGAGGDVPVHAIAVRPDTSTGKKEDSDISVVDANRSLTFILCGLGKNCSITNGKASVARHALLRREALEFALYTFKYVDAVDSVSVFLPPRPDGAASPTSVFIRKADLEHELGKPLTQTIGKNTPTVGAMAKPELATVNRITSPRLYSYTYEQAQDGSAILVYDPVLTGT